VKKEQLEEILKDFRGETDKNISWAGLRQLSHRVLMHFDRMQNLLDAAEEVLRCGVSDRYFDGRPEGNAPSHRHMKPGIWDSSGEVCGWCNAWNIMRKQVRDLVERER
jgi:hypothetical protein